MHELKTKLEKELVVAMESVVRDQINKLDPEGLLKNGAPSDEYKEEIRDITLRLRDITSRSRDECFTYLAETIYVVFSYNFGVKMVLLKNSRDMFFDAVKEIMSRFKEWKLSKKYPQIYPRHLRLVLGSNCGKVGHDGDCNIYATYLKICTCGLHHNLLPFPSEDVEQIYPKFYDELEGKGLVRTLLEEKEMNGLWIKCTKCNGQMQQSKDKCDECKNSGYVSFKTSPPFSEEKMHKMLKEVEWESNKEKE